MVDWKGVRADFPVTQDKAYFISAGMSPVPGPVLSRIEHEYGRINRFGDIHWERDLELYRVLCSRIARHIGAGEGDVAVVMNTSTAMSLVALSLKERHGRGFNMVSMRDEFPATTVPFEYLGIEMRYVKPSGARYPVEEVLRLVDARTLGVVTSYVQYSTGFRHDLSALGAELKRRGLLLIVNATQGFPFYPIDVRTMGIDALGASVHKWGFVGHAGAVFHTSPEFRRRYPAPMAGWLSVDTGEDGFVHTAKDEPFELKSSADRYVMGCINFQAINPLATSLDYLEGIGFEAIRERIAELCGLLIEGLRELGVRIVSPVDCETERSAIVSFSLGRGEEECFRLLEGRGIHLSLRGGYLRAAVNIFNDEGDIERLVGALGDHLKGEGS